MLKLTEDQFYEQFTPIKNHLDDNASFDGCMFETYSPEIDFVFEMAKENRVVTIIEGEDKLGDDGEYHSTLFYSSGYHLVDRLGFLILDKPYTEEFEIEILKKDEIMEEVIKAIDNGLATFIGEGQWF